ncbi:MAG: TPM domain-containing protein [Campylobacteraceae bacterium]|nr:TPM domain-containing protein [Campylobacteraceae bacterium]
MLIVNILSNHVKVVVTFLFISIASLSFANAQSFVFNNKDIDGTNLISDKTVQKIDEIGQELYNKTKISAYAIIDNSTGNLSTKEYIDSYVKDFDTPYTLLLIITEDKIVSILHSPEELSERFNKKRILSVSPQFGGTIKPILSDKKGGNDKYSAALLNGYADLTDQIAKSYNIKLENSIGSTNRSMLDFFRFSIYGFLIVVITIYMIRRIKAKK